MNPFTCTNEEAQKAYKRTLKYRYEKILQGNYGYGWDDLTAYDCDSTGWIKDKEQREQLKSDLKAYRENEPYPHRVIKRRLERGE